MSTKYHVQERVFLNLFPELRAYVIAVVEDTRDRVTSCKEHEYFGDVVLKIADCFKEICLDFDLTSAEERKNSLDKARKLAEVLGSFYHALEVEVHVIEERQTTTQHRRAASAVH